MSSTRAAGLRGLAITASPNFGGNANFGGSGGTLDSGGNDDDNNGEGITWTQVAIGMGLTILAVILYVLYLLYRRRLIQTYMLDRERRAHAASLQYIGDQVVDAETLKEIRTRVVQIIFPPGVTVQSSNTTTSTKEESKKEASTTIQKKIEPESTPTTTPQQEGAETLAETTAGDQTNHQEAENPTSVAEKTNDEEEEGEKPAPVAEKTKEKEDEKRVVAEKTTDDEKEVEKSSVAEKTPDDDDEEEESSVAEKTNENSTTDISNSKAEANNTVVDDDEQEDVVSVVIDEQEAAADVSERSQQQHDVRECAICLGEYKVGDETASSKNCSHVFHRECLLEWSAFKKECPICRTEMWDQTEFERLQKDILACQQEQQEVVTSPTPEGNNPGV